MRAAPVPVNEPCDGPDTMLKVSGSPLASEADNAIAFGVSSFVVDRLASATGASFTDATVIDTAAGAESTNPSLVLKENESGPA